MKKLLPLLFLLTGCGSHYIAPEFSTAVETFKAQAAKHGRSVDDRKLVIEFVPMKMLAGGTDLALCSETDFGQKTIRVAREPWFDPKVVLYDVTGEWAHNQLIWHELGHCLLSRPHRTDWVDTNNQDERPASIMHPEMVAYGAQLKAHESEYWDEMFGGANGSGN